MDRLTAIPLRIGAWRLDPRTGQLSREDEIVRVEARTLRLLLYLAQRAGEVVSLEELLDQVWSGVVVTQDSVYQGVASLRRVLGDDPKQPTYIATVPRLGYRMVASVSPWVDEGQELELPAGGAAALGEARTAGSTAPTSGGARGPVGFPAVGIPGAASAGRPAPARNRPSIVGLLVAVALIALIAAIFTFNSKLQTYSTAATVVPSRSVAVLPFLDLTSESMNEEYFADGMTEELIGQLARIPGLQVPAPTASFYFKGKQVTVAAFAHSLGVAYVLDGSVRKSDTTLRIAARLVRAADGYVVWSNTYDRPEGDRLRVQQDIAGEVAKVLPAAIR
jgi:transcriptional activator of cad operon